jgi:hypothetical protein
VSGKKKALTVYRRNLPLAEEAGADNHFRESQFDRAAVSCELPVGFRICSRSAEDGDFHSWGIFP